MPKRLEGDERPFVHESQLTPVDRIVVVYVCPECGFVHEFLLKDCPGDTFWLCDQCDEAEEPFPEMIGAYVKEVDET
jgi:rubrerythrin